jgi:hypothetical protein
METTSKKTATIDGILRLRVADSRNGFHTVLIEDYEQFTELLGAKYFRDHPEYVYRGHRDPSWPLLPSLYRDFSIRFHRMAKTRDELLTLQDITGRETTRILIYFLYCLRGTQWYDSAQDIIVEWFERHIPLGSVTSEIRAIPHIKELVLDGIAEPRLWHTLVDTWALGQHNGLHTPLLDWTKSLLAAFYFAFSASDTRAEGEECRVVYALNRQLIEQRCASSELGHSALEFVTPMGRNNPRLFAQQGLFTYSHAYESVEDWVTSLFRDDERPVLIRFLIRNVNSREAVRWLARAGISDRTIFPDLRGVCDFSNRIVTDNALDYF